MSVECGELTTSTFPLRELDKTVLSISCKVSITHSAREAYRACLPRITL